MCNIFEKSLVLNCAAISPPTLVDSVPDKYRKTACIANKIKPPDNIVAKLKGMFKNSNVLIKY